MDMGKLQEALALRENGRVEEALRIYRSLGEATDDPDEKASLLLNESTCFAILGLTREARDRFKKALKVQGSAAWQTTFFNFHNACLLSQEGEWEKALDAFNTLLRNESEALKEHDLYQDVQQRRAFMLVRLERHHEALPILKNALPTANHASARSLVLCNLGAASLELQQYEEAERYFLEALEIGVPKEWQGYANVALGRVWYQFGFFEKAKKQFEKCIEKAHEGEYKVSLPFVHEWLAATCRSLGDLEGAERYSLLSKRN